MTNHLTRHCQVITEPQRVRACLALNGISSPQASRSLQHAARQQHAQHAHRVQQQQTQMPPLDLSMLQSQQGWTPLETLAEVSRQINHLSGSSATGHGEEAAQSQNTMNAAGTEPMSGVDMTSASTAETAPMETDPFHVQEHFALASPQSSSPQKDQEQQDNQGQSVAEPSYGGLSSWSIAMQEADLKPLTGAVGPERHEDQACADASADADTSMTENHNLTVAAAAAARLNSAGMLDAGVFGDIERSLEANLEANLGEELARAIGSVDRAHIEETTDITGASPPVSHANAVAASHASDMHSAGQITTPTGFPVTPSQQHRTSTPNSSSRTAASSMGTTPANGQLAWGEITYMSNSAMSPTSHRAAPMVGVPTRSVFRVDQSGTQGRHHRARFSEPRRKEVQSIRKLGACIRCRILRKTCSEGDPCLTCQKVLSPRIWRTGCVRTRVTDKLDIYNARVQAYHCSRHFEAYKTAMDLKHPEVDLEAAQADINVLFDVKVRLGTKTSELYDSTVSAEYQDVIRKVVMIDTDASQNLPEKMQEYVNSVLPELVSGEEATFSRITLETARTVHAEEVSKAEIQDQKSEEMKKAAKTLELALALWGYVEVIERELKWSYKVRPSPVARVAAHTITRDSDEDVFKMLGLQLTAAAEMMAEKTSKELLSHLQGHLSDGKSPIGPPIFFAVLVLLICVEKTTWAFMSWEQIPELRNAWPLEKQPDYFTRQGDGLAEGLRMLLLIRKALPTTLVREEDGVLVDADPESDYRSYFQQINLNSQSPCPETYFAHGYLANLILVDHVYKQRFDPPFHPTTSRTLELRFCSIVLLPEDLLDAAQAPIQALAQAPALSADSDPAVNGRSEDPFQSEPQCASDEISQGAANDTPHGGHQASPLTQPDAAPTELPSASAS